MLDLILSFLPGEWLIGALTALAAVAGIWFGGRKSAQADAKVDALKQEVKAHERMSDADTGVGASDSERIKRLHDFAKRHGG